MKGNKKLPTSVEQAFTNWPEISSQIHDLFFRAPHEAISEPQALLARMALDAVEEPGYPGEVANEVRARANEVIVACAARDKDKIRRALAEPKRLLKQLDGLVASMHAKLNTVHLNHLPHPHSNPPLEGEGVIIMSPLTEEEGNKGMEEVDIKKEGMGKWEAMGQVQNLLDICRHFDKALSDIPAKLKKPNH